MKVDTVRIPRWFERHVHARFDHRLKDLLMCTINQRATGAVFMGNLAGSKETSTIPKTLEYSKAIESLIPEQSDFQPCMTLYLTDDITPKEVVQGFREGVWRAVKLYMANQKGQGGTTGSAHGVKNLLGRYKVFEAMQEYKIPLLGHFEAVEEDVDEFDREIISVERDVKPLLKAFPALQVVFEHLTDGRAADFVVDNKIFATVTAHHLMMNRNWMFWGGMNPGHYCKPVPKREWHRAHIRKLVTSGSPHFGAGTDSAPHDEEAKSHCYGCAAGIFTAPTAVELYTTVFDEDDALEHLGAFMSKNFVGLYGMEVSSEMMTIERTPIIIPERVGQVPVFQGGKQLPWKLVA